MSSSQRTRPGTQDPLRERQSPDAPTLLHMENWVPLASILRDPGSSAFGDRLCAWIWNFGERVFQSLAHSWLPPRFATYRPAQRNGTRRVERRLMRRVANSLPGKSP